MGKIYCFTKSHDNPGSHDNKQPSSSSTKDVFTVTVLRAEGLNSLLSLASMYRDRATMEAAATMAEELILAATRQNCK